MADNLIGALKQEIDPEVWVEKYGDSLYRYALSRLRQQELAEEKVQETFLAALHAKDRFQGRASEKTWLFSILKHKIIDHLRKTTRERPFNYTISQEASNGGLLNRCRAWIPEKSDWESTPPMLWNKRNFLTRCSAVYQKCQNGWRRHLSSGNSEDLKERKSVISWGFQPQISES